MEKITLVNAYSSIFRALQIATLGRLKIAFIATKDLERQLWVLPDIIDLARYELLFNTTLKNAELRSGSVTNDLSEAHIIVELHATTWESIWGRVPDDKALFPLYEEIQRGYKRKIVKLGFKNSSCMALLKTAYSKLDLAPSEISKVLRVAETIAILAEHDTIFVEDIAEAIQYRSIYIPSEDAYVVYQPKD
jgi:hypothetical protein